MEFQVGETHAGYEFLGVLKRSKNGVEFRVKNTLVGRVEALRAIPEGLQNDPALSERFLREMRVHAGLVHPNIVTLFSAVELENQLVITTELVEGPTVADRLVQGPLPWSEAVAISRQILAALAYAHRHGTVHRNISPENIIIGTDGVMKLANFALAKSAGSPKLSQVGVPLGNLKYISPEQIKGMGNVDGRSDLYSLAMVLYEMLCGHPAFVIQSEFELMAAQVGTPPVSPSEVNPKVPRELGAVILKALAKNPAERYQTAAEFDEALVNVKVGEMLKTVPAGPKAVAATAVDEPQAVPAAAGSAPRTQLPPGRPGIPMGGPGAVLQTATEAPVPAFLAARGAPFLSRQQMIIAGTAGAFTGVLLAALWFFVK